VLITAGLVKLTAFSGGNPETGILLSIRGTGDLLGEQDALRELHPDRPLRHRYDADLRPVATALTPVTARSIPTATLRQFLQTHAEVLAAVALGLAEHLEDAESRLASAGRDNADRRLARLLCDLERHSRPPEGRTGGGTVIPLGLSRADLASWIGTSQKTVERALRRWRTRGIVSTGHRTIIVHDRETLARVAGFQISTTSGTGHHWQPPHKPSSDPGSQPTQITPHRGSANHLGRIQGMVDRPSPNW
jgi:CRP-like cAMP-binding protein